MEQKLDLIMEMLKDMNGKLIQIDSRLDRVETDVASVKKTVEFTQQHLGRVDERLTMTEKIQDIYSDKVLKAVL